MNPADRMHNASIDDVAPVAAPERCEMCGALQCGHDSEALSRAHLVAYMEGLFRLCERIMWMPTTNKGVGAMVRVIGAKVLNPSASMRQVAAVVRLSVPQVHAIIVRVRRDMPEIHGALWGNAGIDKGASR